MLRRSAIFMDTTVSIEVSYDADETECLAAIDRAFGWFEHVERACSRFDAESELRKLTATAGSEVALSPLLFEALAFAVALAEASDGAFDPTVGRMLEAAGFRRNYRTGVATPSSPAPASASYRDVVLNRERHAVLLRRPAVLDLGGVAKGFAMDLAAGELQAFARSVVYAGGDVVVRCHDERAGEPFHIGVRDPRVRDSLLAVLSIQNGAVCTSGDYERVGAAGAHHLVDPRAGTSAGAVASVTVVAPSALLADGMATAAFVLGPEQGIELLESADAEGLFVRPTLECVATPGFLDYCR